MYDPNLLNDTLAVVLAGGRGERLMPLTTERAKPAVPFGGKYRIIDFTLTNCMHSGLRRILVFTQYKSHSLQKHLRDGWSIYNPELGEYITVVPPQMRTGDSWYRGTADAIYQNLYLLQRSGARYVVILSGDHIYRMDYAQLLTFHHNVHADLTIASMEVPLGEASQFGVMELDEYDRVTGFYEKPMVPKSCPDKPDRALVSMGVYVFSIEHLLQELEVDAADQSSSHDFGKDIVPRLIDQQATIYAYRFGGKAGRVSPDKYWRDVGSLDSFYEANMDLLKPIPPLNLYQSDWAIRSYSGQHPPARTVPSEMGTEGILINSITAGGTVIAGGSVQASILFQNVFVDEDAIVESSLLFDGVHVGKACQLHRCIVEKDVQIPEGTIIGFDAEDDLRRFTVSDQGVVVVPKGYQFS